MANIPWGGFQSNKSKEEQVRGSSSSAMRYQIAQGGFPVSAVDHEEESCLAQDCRGNAVLEENKESPSGEYRFPIQSESQRMVESLSRPWSRGHGPWGSFDVQKTLSGSTG